MDAEMDFVRLDDQLRKIRAQLAVLNGISVAQVLVGVSVALVLLCRKLGLCCFARRARREEQEDVGDAGVWARRLAKKKIKKTGTVGGFAGLIGRATKGRFVGRRRRREEKSEPSAPQPSSDEAGAEIEGDEEERLDYRRAARPFSPGYYARYHPMPPWVDGGAPRIYSSIYATPVVPTGVSRVPGSAHSYVTARSELEQEAGPSRVADAALD